MKNSLTLCFLVAAALVATAAGAPDEATTVQGNWKPAAAELGGKPMPPAVLKTISMKLEGGRYEVWSDGRPDYGTYAIDTGTAPKGMTITGTDGPNKGKTFPAIYEIAGDTLRICYDLSGAKRPAEFKTLPGSLLYLVAYERVKP